MWGGVLELNKLTFPLFIKDVDGQCGSFVKKIRSQKELQNLFKILKEGSYLIQQAVNQSDELNAIYPNAVNTLRIVTTYNNGQPIVFSSVLRVGTNQSGNIDNWAMGGIAVGINNGRLRRDGLYKPSYGTKTDIHPDTGFLFSDYKLSQYMDAEKIACKAHEQFNNVHSIGWDIACTDEGPVIIEGNDNWEISLMQACNTPLKQRWDIEK